MIEKRLATTGLSFAIFGLQNAYACPLMLMKGGLLCRESGGLMAVWLSLPVYLPPPPHLCKALDGTEYSLISRQSVGDYIYLKEGNFTDL
jgi:hypothetical protein